MTLRRILIASGCDKPYYPQMQAFMKSVEQHKGPAEAFLIGAGWQPPSECGFKGVHLPLDLTAGHGGTWCVQHGGFLHALPAEDSDVVIFCDGGDIVMQRDLSERELAMLTALDGSTIAVGYNSGPHETLRQEARRLEPKSALPDIFDLNIPCYNTGVVAATIEAYRKLYAGYIRMWHEIAPRFGHYAKQQWLMSAVLGSDPGLKHSLLPGSFHTHGHHGVPQGCRFDKAGTLYREGEVVLFRHRI